MFKQFIVVCSVSIFTIYCTTAFSAPLDTFSGSTIDSGIWYATDPPLDKIDTHNTRQVVSGQLEMSSITTGTSGNYSTNTTTIYLQESLATRFVQTDVTISSQSAVPSNGLGQVRVEGAFYNSKYSLPRPGLLDGEVFAYVRIDQNGDGSFYPYAFILQCDDDTCNTGTELYNQPLGCTVNPDIPATVSILYEIQSANPYPTFTFTCDESSITATLSGAPSISGSNTNYRRLRTRAYTNIGSTSTDPTELKVFFDNYRNSQVCSADGWCKEETPDGNYSLLGIWGSSSNNVYAVGSDGTNGYLFQYNGTSWTTLSSTIDEPLYDICGLDSNDIYAVGANGFVYHYDGGSWSSMATGTTNSLKSIWCHNKSSIYSVDSNGGVYKYDGNQWSEIRAGVQNQNIFTIWGSDVDDIYIGGDDSNYEAVLIHYDGDTWSPVDFNLGMYSRFYEIWGLNQDTIFIAGTYGVSQFDGTNWSTTNPNGMWMHSIFGFSDQDVYIADDVGQILHFDGNTWEASATPIGALPTFYWYDGIWGPCSSDVFAVGESTILHRKGAECPSVSTSGFPWAIYFPAIQNKKEN